jgi:hypothetical protein
MIVNVRTLLFGMIAVAQAAGQTPSYKVDAIAVSSANGQVTPPGNFTTGYGLAINRTGDVTGWIAEANDQRKTVFFWAGEQNSVLQLPTQHPLDLCSRPSAIDEQRYIYCDQFVVLDASRSGLPALPRCTPQAPPWFRTRGVDARGLGAATRFDLPYDSFLFRVVGAPDGCVIRRLESLGGTNGAYAMAVRQLDAGDWIATGWMMPMPSNFNSYGQDPDWFPGRACVWRKGNAPVLLPNLPDGRTPQAGVAVNLVKNELWLVGRTAAANPVDIIKGVTAFVAKANAEGDYRTEELPPVEPSDIGYTATGIDSQGAITGSMQGGGNAGLWSRGANGIWKGFYLDSLAVKPVGCTSFHIVQANAMNDAGQITGAATCDNRSVIVRLTRSEGLGSKAGKSPPRER